MASHTLTIAVAGHRDLREQDLPILNECVRKKLIQLGKSNNLRLLCGLADGADQLVGTIAAELNIPVVPVITSGDPLPTAGTGYQQAVQLPAPRSPEGDLDNGKAYENIGRYLVSHADHFLFLWDGVYNGKIGGTSEVVRMALEGARPLTIHHLLTPRQQNDYPITPLLRRSSGKTDAVMPLAVNFSWVTHVVTPVFRGGTVTQLWKRAVFFFGSELFLSFGLPMLLVASTIALGTVGFLRYNAQESIDNALFKAVNLLTFNNSVLDYKSDLGPVPMKLHFARFLGLATTMSTFFIALYFALGVERKRLKIVFWQYFLPDRYVLVLGLGQKSYDLIKDLTSNGFKVGVLANNEDSVYKNDVERIGAVYLKGSISSVRLLQKMYYHRAREVYLMSDTDSDNVRAAQELDNLTGKLQSDQKWYVHVQDSRSRTFLHNHLSALSRQRLVIFDIYENTARRLQLYHPMDRFFQTPQAHEAHVVVLGFGNLGKKLVLNALRQGHFERGKRLKITVLCTNAVQEEALFHQLYPVFDLPQTDAGYQAEMVADIWQKGTLAFHELPLSDAGLLSSKNILFNNILAHEHIVNLYACFEDGFTSAAVLSTLLPKLEYSKNLHRCNLRVFCFYNFPDKKEEETVERHFNKLAPNTPVLCFGNFIDECSVAGIKDLALDVLPKQIAYWYERGFGDQSRSFDAAWKACSEPDKEANRQAADHLWVKLRTILSAPRNQSADLFEILTRPETYLPHMVLLGEMEHRRWSANLLLNGITPLQDEASSLEEWQSMYDQWYDAAGKRVLKANKLHIALRPFDKLEEKEKAKDEDQIRQIPHFLHGIYGEG